MTKKEIQARKAEVEKSLMEQLQQKGATVPHFVELIRDYAKFWEISKLLQADIDKRGIVFVDVSAAGVKMQKNNPSVKELEGVNRQMIAIIDKLGLTTDNVGTAVDGEDCGL